MSNCFESWFLPWPITFKRIVNKLFHYRKKNQPYLLNLKILNTILQLGNLEVVTPQTYLSLKEKDFKV